MRTRDVGRRKPSADVVAEPVVRVVEQAEARGHGPVSIAIRKFYDGPVSPQRVRFPRDESLGDQRDQRLQAAVREDASERRPSEREQQALDQQLLNETRAARAERSALACMNGTPEIADRRSRG